MREELSYQLVEIEISLNNYNYKNAPIGALFGKLNGNINRGIHVKKSFIRYFSKLIKFLLIGLKQSKLSVDPPGSKIKLMFSKLADRTQCNKLIDPLYYNYPDSVLWKFYEKGDLGNSQSDKRISLFKLPSLFYCALKFTLTTRHHYSTIPEVTISDVFLVYFFGLVRMNNWITFYKKTNIQLLVVDFDRDNKSSPMVLAANACGIKTITMLHGVMNPPYGLSFVVANEIFVWGNFQQRYLLGKGIEEHRVFIVGNAIIEKFSKPQYVNHDSEQMEIGVALNPMSESYNKLFVHNIFNYSIENNSIKFTVKLHPSMIKADWMLELQNPNLTFCSYADITSASFFGCIEALVVGNSGIGYEAIVNDVPVGVINLNNSKGNDFVMINVGKFPDVTSKESFNQFMIDIESKVFLKSLLKKQKEFVFNEYYLAIGDDAVKNAINLIDAKIYS